MLRSLRRKNLPSDYPINLAFQIYLDRLYFVLKIFFRISVVMIFISATFHIMKYFKIDLFNIFSFIFSCLITISIFSFSFIVYGLLKKIMKIYFFNNKSKYNNVDKDKTVNKK